MADALQNQSTPIGSRIRTMRRARRLTQRELSQRTGLAEAFLSRVENGRVAPSLHTLQRLADGLGVCVGDLLGTPSATVKLVCPVSYSGRCIAELIYVPGRHLRWSAEHYTPRQIGLLRLGNYLVQFGGAETLAALETVMLAMLKLPGTRRNRQWLRTLERRPSSPGRPATRDGGSTGGPEGSAALEDRDWS
ncbi:MAG: helix-turn-helix transcriptional regulator [Acidobacteria bacterium]|nr:helix-turn-helix transcriptional regulator [Acidobacteriota bacterium]